MLMGVLPLQSRQGKSLYIIFQFIKNLRIWKIAYPGLDPVIRYFTGVIQRKFSGLLHHAL